MNLSEYVRSCLHLQSGVELSIDFADINKYASAIEKPVNTVYGLVPILWSSEKANPYKALPECEAKPMQQAQEIFHRYKGYQTAGITLKSLSPIYALSHLGINQKWRRLCQS